MSLINYLQTNFNAGVISPKAYGRPDIQKYANALKRLHNFYCTLQGGAFKRIGSYFASEVKDSSMLTLIKSFIFSTKQAYAIEFGNQYFRFYKGENGEYGQIETSPGVPYEISNPYLEADLRGISTAQSADVLYIVNKNYAPRKLTRTGHTSWTLSTINFIDGPYLSINKTSTTINPSHSTGTTTLTASASLFTANDVGRHVRFKSGSAWGYCKITAYTSATQVTAEVNADFPLPATGATKDWRLGAFYIGNYPSTVTFYEERLCFGGLPQESEFVACSKIGDFEVFSPTDKDAKVLDDSGITFKVVSDQVNSVQWLSGLNSLLIGTAGAEFKVDSGSESKAFTPTTLTRKLQTTNGSTYEEKKIPTVSTNNAVVYVDKTGQGVYELTYDNVLLGYKSNQLNILSEHVLREGGYAVDMAFQRTRNSIIWMAMKDGNLASMTYLPAQEVIGWATHSLGGRLAGELNPFVESICCIPSPDGTEDQLWMVVKRTIDGQTKRYVEYLRPDFQSTDPKNKDDAFYLDSGVTYNDPKTITGATNANPVQVTVVGHGFTTGDKIRIRNVKGMTELNGLNYEITVVDADNFELNGIDGTNYEEYVSGGVARKHVTVVNGLDHLEGETVTIFADGGLQTDKVVSGGSITLDYSASFIHAGLRYQSYLTTLPTEGGGNNGTAQGKFKRSHRVVVRVWNAMELKVRQGDYVKKLRDSNDKPNYLNYNFREKNFIMDEAPELFTGDIELDLLGEYTREGLITILSNDPVPLNVLAIMPEGKVYG